MSRTRSAMQPLYLQVKNHILQHIDSGQWSAAARVPSENELVREFGVSRMTANRALRELQGEGVVVRIAGVGSFVAERQLQTHPLRIQDIAQEIGARGHVHRAQLVTLRKVRASPKLAADFGIAVRSELFQSTIVHHEDEVPMLLEERHVLPRIAPAYLQVDFARVTPYEYLMQVAPLQQAEHVLRAMMPDERTRALLRMKRQEPCLLVRRRSWSAGAVASVAHLYYPGSRYAMSGRFLP